MSRFTRREALVTMAAASAVPASAAALAVGDKAPDFELSGSKGTVKLSSYMGKKNVVAAFYPKAFTGG